jgi:hypothetical protein
MPFKPPFNKKISPGDLVYGLNNVRNYYAHSYKEFKLAKNLGNLIFINSYMVTQYEKEQQIKKNQPIPGNQDSFIEALCLHPKYKEAYLANYFPVSMYSNKDGLFISDVQVPEVIRRKSKAGLYWAAQNSLGSSRFSIHFLLDDINMEEVVKKSNKKDRDYPDFKAFISEYLKDKEGFELNRIRASPTGAIKERAITSAELRWLYRNRYDGKVQAVIQFWYKGEPCCPPWERKFDKHHNGESISKKWLTYTPTNMNLYDAERGNTSEILSGKLARLIRFFK